MGHPVVCASVFVVANGVINHLIPLINITTVITTRLTPLQLDVHFACQYKTFLAFVLHQLQLHFNNKVVSDIGASYPVLPIRSFDWIYPFPSTPLTRASIRQKMPLKRPRDSANSLELRSSSPSKRSRPNSPAPPNPPQTPYSWAEQILTVPVTAWRMARQYMTKEDTKRISDSETCLSVCLALG